LFFLPKAKRALLQPDFQPISTKKKHFEINLKLG